MAVAVYFDLVCPWAWIARRRLAAALELLGPDAPTVTWRPILLDPTAPGTSTSLADSPEAEAAQLQSVPGFALDLLKHRVAQLATAEGLPTPVPAWRVSTWAAHRLVQAAGERNADLEAAVIDHVMDAHFAGRDINELEFLRDAASRFGLRPPTAPEGASHAPAYLEPGFDPHDPTERRTREALWTGRAGDVTSSPTLVVDGRPLAGVQAVETMADHLSTPGEPERELPDEVRRFRLAEALLDRRDPHGCLYVLAPLRPQFDGERNLELLSARALVATASLVPARDKLERLLDAHPDDAYLHHLLGRTLRRLGDDRAPTHLAIAAALDPGYGA
jgi:predicted DsbA family dithiol-disulfide isomerase